VLRPVLILRTAERPFLEGVVKGLGCFGQAVQDRFGMDVHVLELLITVVAWIRAG
jgi:hypothetical protein